MSHQEESMQCRSSCSTAELSLATHNDGLFWLFVSNDEGDACGIVVDLDELEATITRARHIAPYD